jgi:hypothetical protein
MADIEMEDLSQRDNRETEGVEPEAVPDAVSTFWAWTTASLSVFILDLSDSHSWRTYRLILISLILSVSPRLLLFVSETAARDGPGEKRTILTPLEAFLALHASIWLCAVAISLVLNVRATLILFCTFCTQ